MRLRLVDYLFIVVLLLAACGDLVLKGIKNPLENKTDGPKHKTAIKLKRKKGMEKWLILSYQKKFWKMKD
ncbi:hypothetical protein C0971_14920 [Bacillus methanolicus]|nr:hypothetical protein C0971_14920 [Bacillus methanolicus]